MKIVIIHTGGKGSVGVQDPKCDPVFTVVEGDLDAALSRVPGLVEEARRRWETNQLYPKCEHQLPSQVATPSRTPTRPAPQPATTQERMF